MILKDGAVLRNGFVLNFRNHFFICAGLGVLLSGKFLTWMDYSYLFEGVLIIIFTIAGGLYPDFPYDESLLYPYGLVNPEWGNKIGDVTHRAKGIRRSTLPFWIWLLLESFWFHGEGMPLVYMIAFVIGQLVHLTLDSLTEIGIPFRKKRIALGWIKNYDIPWFIRAGLTIVLLLQGAYLWSPYLGPFFDI